MKLLQISLGIIALSWSFQPALVMADLPQLVGEIVLDEDVPNETSKSDQSGDIHFEELGEDRDPYNVNQDLAIKYFTELYSQTQQIGAGKIASVQPLKSDALLHVAGVYLFCVTKRGVCPDILNSILEIDVINSKIAGKVSCPTMREFWSLWKQQQFQRRQDYSVPLSYIHKVQEFQSKELPRLVNCEDTIRSIITEGPSDTAAFFKDRYQDARLPMNIATTAQMLKLIKKKVPNIFTYTRALP